MADDETTTAEHPAPRARSPLPEEKYRVGRELGRGGMGEVRAAHDDVIGREVAIKRLHDDRSSEEHEARFIREARIQGRLDHPAIPPVYELGRDRTGRPYIVMKRLVGTTLADILTSAETGGTPVARERLLRAFVDVCLAIELAHARGVVHRDIKPANIMLGEYGEVYVLDWGVAKVLDDSDAGGDQGLDLGSEDSTRTGAVIGTPSYMAPEQREGRPDVDGRADIYALGRLLAEILAGKRIRPGSTEAPQRPSTHAIEAAIPPELDELCVQATAADRDLRIQRARILANRVQAYLDGDRDLAQRRTLAEAHLARALAAGSGEAAVAMREASRALALDPTLVAAADLVGRLMLEPPKELPAEVVESLHEMDAVSGRQQARQGTVAYAAYLLFLPSAAVIGVRSATPLLALLGLAIVLAGTAWFVATSPDGKTMTTFAWPAYVTVIGNAMVVAVLTRMFTTFLLAPGIGAITAMVLFRSAVFRSRWLFTIACLSLGVLLPWLAELTGVLESTSDFTGHTLQLHSAVLLFTEAPLIGALIVYTIGSLAFVAMMSNGYARTQRALDERLHLYAWRLRQLAPTRAA